MPAFMLLSPELRYNILRHVVISASNPLDPPDVDKTDPKDWRPCRVWKTPALLRAETPAFLQRTQCPTARLLPYLLVSKFFQQDIQHVWTRYVAPTLFPVLSMSLVGADRDRPMRGTLVSWLSPLPTSPDFTRIEWHIRLYDQHANPTGRTSLRRFYEEAGTIFDLTLVDVFERAFLRDWYALRSHFSDNDTGYGYWVVKLSTDVDPDVHFASSEYFEVQDPLLKVMPHPYRDASALRDHLHGYIEFDILTGAEIWVDDTLVYRLTPRRKARPAGIESGTSDNESAKNERNDVMCEKFEYAMPVDPLLPPKPAPEHVVPDQIYTNAFLRGLQG